QPDAGPSPVRLRAEYLRWLVPDPAHHRWRLPPCPPPVPDHSPVPVGAGGLRHLGPGPLAGAARPRAGAGDPAGLRPDRRGPGRDRLVRPAATSRPGRRGSRGFAGPVRRGAAVPPAIGRDAGRLSHPRRPRCPPYRDHRGRGRERDGDPARSAGGGRHGGLCRHQHPDPRLPAPADLARDAKYRHVPDRAAPPGPDRASTGGDRRAARRIPAGEADHHGDRRSLGLWIAGVARFPLRGAHRHLRGDDGGPAEDRPVDRARRDRARRRATGLAGDCDRRPGPRRDREHQGLRPLARDRGVAGRYPPADGLHRGDRRGPAPWLDRRVGRRPGRRRDPGHRRGCPDPLAPPPRRPRRTGRRPPL
ncbi:MAG: hypothetical protein AVDCRST_MAG88-1014, partial [uncultured Thermomicrobiales bacterium]